METGLLKRDTTQQVAADDEGLRAATENSRLTTEN